MSTGLLLVVEEVELGSKAEKRETIACEFGGRTLLIFRRLNIETDIGIRLQRRMGGGRWVAHFIWSIARIWVNS
jgi:hypothetical protein